ncbi:hypothetical protein ACHAXR_008519 [Thalassiosira sp. AJA248-18]
MTAPMNEQQQHHDDPGLHQSTPSGYVNPRIQAIERRMQLRTPGQAALPTNSRDDSNDMIRPNNDKSSTTANSSGNSSGNVNALALHSPILSSIQNHSNIKQFESDVLKRQAGYSARISDLSGRLALFHTRLAVECADRGREHAFTMDEYVNGPLEEATRRGLQAIETEFVMPIMDPKRATSTLMGNAGGSRSEGDSGGDQSSVENKRENNISQAAQNDGSNQNDSTAATAKTTSNPLPNLVTIERHTNLLEAQMNHHQHVTLFHSRRQHFDTIDKACRQNLQPALALEMTKADKREGSMVRRFDGSSGEYTRLISETTSSRVSSLVYIEREIDNWDISDLKKAEFYLDEIQRLKAKVLEEREERLRQDELVVKRIVQNKKMLEEDIFLAC